jgi:integrase
LHAHGPADTVRHFDDLLRWVVDGLGLSVARMRYSNWRRRIWLPATEAAGCAGAGFHDLRRLNATTLVVGGIDVKTAQTRLGHADPRMTLAIYASAPESVDKTAADLIGERFFGDGPKNG